MCDTGSGKAAGFRSAFKISSMLHRDIVPQLPGFSSVFESSLSLSAVHHVHVCVTLAQEKPQVSILLSKYRRCFTETSCRGYLVFQFKRQASLSLALSAVHRVCLPYTSAYTHIRIPARAKQRGAVRSYR